MKPIEVKVFKNDSFSNDYVNGCLDNYVKEDFSSLEIFSALERMNFSRGKHKSKSHTTVSNKVRYLSNEKDVKIREIEKDVYNFLCLLEKVSLDYRDNVRNSANSDVEIVNSNIETFRSCTRLISFYENETDDSYSESIQDAAFLLYTTGIDFKVCDFATRLELLLLFAYSNITTFYVGDLKKSFRQVRDFDPFSYSFIAKSWNDCKGDKRAFLSIVKDINRMTPVVLLFNERDMAVYGQGNSAIGEKRKKNLKYMDSFFSMLDSVQLDDSVPVDLIFSAFIVEDSKMLQTEEYANALEMRKSIAKVTSSLAEEIDVLVSFYNELM